MPARSASRAHAHSLAAMLLVASLLATWFAYLPGMGGSLHFDDPPNLQGLASVNDSVSAFAFVASGSAGPLGRPLTLASFLPEADAWPFAPEVFLRTNILIHLINGALVAWFLYLLGLARNQIEKEAALIGVGAGAIWMLMPLLASSSLLVVQRMTTLSAMFMLLGAVGYLYARRAIDKRPVAALLGMAFSIGVGASLGILAKENGALLFLFILAVEATLLKRPAALHRTMWRVWFGLFLAGPLVVLLLFLVSAVPYSESEILRRDFNGFERLITQAEVLWKYLYLAFLPNVPNLGPFHDDFAVRRSISNPSTILAVSGWIVVIVTAAIFRRRAPLFAFAVSWFLLGHLLESTTLSLELYFEHRNYMPLIGPVYALVASMRDLVPSARGSATIVTVCYATILGGILFSVTSLWGSPIIAAEMWSIYKPESMRATIFLAQRLEQQGDLYTARRVLKEFLESSPDDQGVGLFVLGISCQSTTNTDHSREIRVLESRLSETRFHHFVLASYQSLDEAVRSGQCIGVSKDSVYRLGVSILENPRFDNALVTHNVHILLSRLAVEQRDLSLTMSHIDSALARYPNVKTLRLAIEVLSSAGLDEEAWSRFNEFHHRPLPIHPLRAAQVTSQLDEIESFLVRSDASSTGTNRSVH